VLLAEDDADIRGMIAAVLRRDGYEVDEVTDGAELLDHVGSALLGEGPTPPDVIVSDIRMPGFTGLQVLAGLRDSNWEIPILLITAFGGELARAEAERLGANRFFLKPFDLDELRTAILALVPTHVWMRYSRRRAHARHN
jgi:CheY-like chemotaxis protein